MRTSAPMIMKLVCDMYPSTPASSSPNGNPLRTRAKYVCANESGLLFRMLAWFVFGSIGPCVPSFM